MLPFFLYFVTGLVTGIHVYLLLAFTVYGAPFNPLELVSLLGSMLLLVAACVSLFRPHGAARLALIAALAMWCFYAPAIKNLMRTHVLKPARVSRVISPPLMHSAAMQGSKRCLT
ncbi:MAG TPA: hypothetical protein VGM18_07930 [Candidatus Sulfotelmatobacter sp.]